MTVANHNPVVAVPSATVGTASATGTPVTVTASATDAGNDLTAFSVTLKRTGYDTEADGSVSYGLSPATCSSTGTCGVGATAADVKCPGPWTVVAKASDNVVTDATATSSSFTVAVPPTLSAYSVTNSPFEVTQAPAIAFTLSHVCSGTVLVDCAVGGRGGSEERAGAGGSLLSGCAWAL